MKKIYLLLLLSSILSCTFDTTYQYVQLNDEGLSHFVEAEPKTIRADNDSLAYLDAFAKYVIALKVAGEMNAEYGNSYPVKPRNFLLFDSDERLVSDPIPIEYRDSIYSAIEARIYSQ